MFVYNHSKKDLSNQLPNTLSQDQPFLVLCHVSEISTIQEIFNFDESTILSCTDLDESVRFANFNHYDFISLVHMEYLSQQLSLYEINLYVSSYYVVMVMPDNQIPQLYDLEQDIINTIQLLKTKKGWTNVVLYTIFDFIFSSLSDMLERLEDDLVLLQEEIISDVNKSQFERISYFRQLSYTIKKQLRASSYLGMQMLVDSNLLIHKDNHRFFYNIDTRLKKLYDFSESLYEFSSQLLYSYDSRLTMRTNDAVNKLTIFTVFFGPLTVITGIYGMNFSSMPELNWDYGYPLSLLMMVLITLVVYWILKKKKWLS